MSKRLGKYGWGGGDKTSSRSAKKFWSNKTYKIIRNLETLHLDGSNLETLHLESVYGSNSQNFIVCISLEILPFLSFKETEAISQRRLVLPENHDAGRTSKWSNRAIFVRKIQANLNLLLKSISC